MSGLAVRRGIFIIALNRRGTAGTRDSLCRARGLTRLLFPGQGPTAGNAALSTI